MAAVFLIPFVIVIAFAFLVPPVYDNTFLGELSEKYDRLKGTDEPKIVIVAGSSSAFGLDSGMMSEKLGKEVVNFGLYANLGTKLMMDLSKENINSRDIIVLAPELNAQTYSLYFNAETAAQALDGAAYMLKNIDGENRAALTGALWKFSGDKIKYALSGRLPENTGAYRKEFFNEYGDNTYDRPYSVLTGYGNPITLDFNGSSDYDEYIEYVNDYVRYAEKRGATVYFSFPPMNEEAVRDYNSDNDILAFYQKLVNDLDCKVISNIFDYILDPGYFYDSEFHLNNSGVTVRTVLLIDDIKREAGDVSKTVDDLPEPSGKRPDCEDFELRRIENDRAWKIVSLTEAGRGKTRLVIPDEINGIPVAEISRGAISDADSLTLLTLGKNVRRIAPGAIDGAKSLLGIVLPEQIKPGSLSVSYDSVIGCAEGFKIYVSPDSVGDYRRAAGLEEVKELIEPDESFKYESDGSALKIVALTETGKTRSELTVPDEVGGKPVTVLGAFALSDSEALEVITLGSNIKELETNSLPMGEISVNLPYGISSRGFMLPDDPNALGGSYTLNADFRDYDRLISDYPGYAGKIATDNLWFKLQDSGGFWTVSGVNSRGCGQNTLEIPDTVSGMPVKTVADGALKDAGAVTLILGNNISRLDGGALSSGTLKTVVIPDGKGAGDISVPNSMSEKLATDGAPDDLRISVDPSEYSGFTADYFWGDYGKYLESR